MITIEINKIDASPEELEYLNSFPNFNESISTLMNQGRRNGVSMCVKEIAENGAITHIKNSENGVARLVVGSSGKGKSFLTQE